MLQVFPSIVRVLCQSRMTCPEGPHIFQLLTVAASVEAILGAAVINVATSSLLRGGGLWARASSTRTLRLVVTIHFSSSTRLVSKNFDESRRERMSFSLASTSHVMLLCSRIS